MSVGSYLIKTVLNHTHKYDLIGVHKEGRHTRYSIFNTDFKRKKDAIRKAKYLVKHSGYADVIIVMESFQRFRKPIYRVK